MMQVTRTQARWIMPIFILVVSMGYLIATKPKSESGSSETSKSVKSFVGFHYYELNMEGELPMTSPCAPVNEEAALRFASYVCTESDDRILSDWSCVKPSTGEAPAREYIEISQGDLASCQKKLEDFRERFQ